jgi:hypothetical protein
MRSRWAMHCVSTALLGLALLGCNGSPPRARVTTVVPSRPLHVRAAAPVLRSSSRAAYRRLIHLKDFSAPQSTAHIYDVAVSSDGSLVAFWGDTRSGFTFVRVVSRARDGKTLDVHYADYSIGRIALHPTKPLLAMSGGTAAEPVRPGHSPTSAYKVVNVSTGHTRTFPKSDQYDPPLTWLPDGIRLLSGTGEILNSKSGKLSVLPGIELDRVLVPGIELDSQSGISVSVDWHLAADYFSHGERAPHLDVYRRRNANSNQWDHIAMLPAALSADGATVASYRTQPSFLSSGRLAFVRVFLGPNGSRKRLEIWSSAATGRDEQPLVKLPMTLLSNSSVPVGWSADSRVVAYAEGKVVRVFITK